MIECTRCRSVALRRKIMSEENDAHQVYLNEIRTARKLRLVRLGQVTFYLMGSIDRYTGDLDQFVTLDAPGAARRKAFEKGPKFGGVTLVLTACF